MLDMTVARIYRETLSTSDEKEGGATDLTAAINEIVGRSKIDHGMVHVFAVGSTSAIVSIEFEGGLLQDLRETLRRLIPRDLNYHHGRAWRDDNAHSHLRATLLGPQMLIPIADGKPELGDWQHVAVVNLDSRPRDRTVIVNVFGK